MIGDVTETFYVRYELKMGTEWGPVVYGPTHEQHAHDFYRDLLDDSNISVRKLRLIRREEHVLAEDFH